MDVGSLVAIDMHTHAEVSRAGAASLPAELMAASARYFKVSGGRTPVRAGDRRVLPGAADGRGGVHRGRRVGDWATRRCPATRWPRTARPTPTS